MIFIGICVICLAMIIFMSTKKGEEWMNKFD